MLLSSGKNFSNFETKLKGLNRFAWDIVKLIFCPEIYERSFQISEIEIVITFEWNSILTFCKKQWLRLIEIFKNYQTSFFDSWHPYRLNRAELYFLPLQFTIEEAPEDGFSLSFMHVFSATW